MIFVIPILTCSEIQPLTPDSLKSLGIQVLTCSEVQTPKSDSFRNLCTKLHAQNSGHLSPDLLKSLSTKIQICPEIQVAEVLTCSEVQKLKSYFIQKLRYLKVHLEIQAPKSSSLYYLELCFDLIMDGCVSNLSKNRFDHCIISFKIALQHLNKVHKHVSLLVACYAS